MLNKIIQFSIKNKFIIGLFTLGLVVWGIYSATRLPIDALPDITNNQVQIITTSPTLATEEVEKYITFPIERAVKSVPNIVELRSVSRFGLSLVTVVFSEETDIYWARTQINERLKEAASIIPAAFGQPELAPVSTGLGEIYQYCVEAKPGFEDQFDIMELRSIQDWMIAPQILGTKGVAEVNTLGGVLKEYEVAVEPDKLKSMDITMSDIFEALKKNNENTGGAYIDKKPNAYYIRGIGMINSLEEIKKIVVKVDNNIPKLIRDVAEVRYGKAIRYGATTKNGKGEVVSGMVMMLKGENSAEVVGLVKDKVVKIQKTLPEGVIITPFLDRSKLVERAIGTVEKNLIEGALIVIFILVLLIGNWRAGLIVASVIPLALLFAISMMRLFGVSGNLMSLGAIDFGLIVDGAVIIVEAIIHRIYNKKNQNKVLTQTEMDANVFEASSKIRSSAAFGEIIILIVYLPILALVGIEGKMFAPMAQTVSFAILGAFILSLTYVPMISSLFLSKKIVQKETFSDKIIAFFNKIYQFSLKYALKVKGLVLTASLLIFIFSIFTFNRMGGEFIPNLEEGDIATHIIIPPGSSLEQEIDATTLAQKILLENFPEIEQAVAKIGSAEVPTDPMPMEVADMMIIMKDKKEWTTASTQAEMVEKMEHVLDQIPGMTTEFSQPIQMRFNELMTGIRSDVGVKIFGEDLAMLEGMGNQAVTIIQSVQGVQDARLETVSGLPQLKVDYDKDKLALYGLNVSDLNEAIQMGFAGKIAGVVYEGERRFNLVVRLKNESRNDINDLKNMFISLPNGFQIPLEQVANIHLEKGPSQISREEGKRRIIIGFNVRDRDVQSVVEEIQSKLNAQITLPPGYFIKYAGQFQSLVTANKRLAIALPIALALIFILLYFTFKNVGQSLLIFTAIPLSAIGGVFALYLRDMPFSISAGVGFIALFGVAVLNGIVLISYFNQLKAEGMTNIMDRIKEGTTVRLRPVLMTAGVASLGFLPMALSTSAGAEVQKPLATVVIGGLITATFLTLILLPILYYYLETFSGKFKQRKTDLMLLLMVTFSLNGISQTQTLSLEQAIEMGMTNNQQLRISNMNVTLNTQQKKAAFEMPNTRITGSFGQINTFNFDQQYSVTQGINPVLIAAKKQLYTQEEAVSMSEFELEKQSLVLNIRTAWTDLLYLKDLQKEYIAQDSLYKKFAQMAALKYEVGEGNVLEKTTAETWQLEFEQTIFHLNTAIQNQVLKIQLLLNLKNDFLPLESELVNEQYLVKEDSSRMQNNPLLEKAGKEYELALSNAKLKKAAIFPEIELGYFVQSMKGTQEKDGQPVYYNGSPQFHGFSIGLAIPLFSTAERTRYRMAKTAIDIQETTNDYLYQQLSNQLRIQIQEWVNYQMQLAFYQNAALPNAALILEKAQKAYAAGDIAYVEYGQALNTSFTVQKNYLDLLQKSNNSLHGIKYLINE